MYYTHSTIFSHYFVWNFLYISFLSDTESWSETITIISIIVIPVATTLDIMEIIVIVRIGPTKPAIGITKLINKQLGKPNLHQFSYFKSYQKPFF